MSAFMRFTVPGLLAIAEIGSAGAQSRVEVACTDDWIDGSRSGVHVCESRELTLEADDLLEIDASPNGSVRVTGWDRGEARVRALVRSWDRDEEAARARLDEIEIGTDGVVRAYGPEVRTSWWPFGRRGGWHVDFEIMAPDDTHLWIESVNGRISVAGMRGTLDAETVNGGISLADVAAAVRARTVNGGISAEFANAAFDGEIFDVSTVNGGVVIRIPDGFPARFDVETVNGGVDSDFPVTREARRGRMVSATLGSGGPLIRARTVNGGVQLRQF